MSTHLRNLAVGLGLLSILLVTGPCLAADPGKPPIRINGAAMASDQVQLIAKEFMAANPTVNVIVTGSSAGKGFEALFEGNADIALASRATLPNENEKAAGKGFKLDNRQIGHAGMAVVTSQKNPITELTMDQLKQIFLGERRNWKELGGPDLPIRCLTRRVPESGGAVLFMEKVLHNSPYGPTTVFAESWSAIMKICAVADDLPIGMGPVFIVRGEVKIIPIKKDQASPAIKPTAETLKDQSYPIIDPIFMYWDKRTENQDLQRFIDFCAGKGLKTN